MHVEKTISPSELEVLLKKHFEKEVGEKLSSFTVKKSDAGSYSISYDTELVAPSATDKAREAVAGAVSGLKSIFGR